MGTMKLRKKRMSTMKIDGFDFHHLDVRDSMEELIRFTDGTRNWDDIRDCRDKFLLTPAGALVRCRHGSRNSFLFVIGRDDTCGGGAICEYKLYNCSDDLCCAVAASVI